MQEVKASHVFIEAFASAMFSVEPSSRMGTPLKPMMRLGLKEYVADFGSVFFSVNGLNSAMRSAWLNRRRARDHWVLSYRLRVNDMTKGAEVRMACHENTGVARVLRAGSRCPTPAISS